MSARACVQATTGGGMGAATPSGSFLSDGMADTRGVGFLALSWWSNFQEKFSGKNWESSWREVERLYWESIEKGIAAAKREFGAPDPFIRKLCQKDLFFLAKEVLGYEDVSFRLHFPLCQFASEKSLVHRLVLIPRKHFKTSVVTIAGCVQDVINDPEIAILLGTGTPKLVRQVMTELKAHFEMNAKFRGLFPELVPASGKEWGTLEAFTVPNRKKPRKEPTVMAASTGTKITGMSFDKFYGDDLVNEDNCTTKAQLDAVEEWYGMLRFVLKFQMETPQTISGTRYHFSDLYSKLLNKDVAKNGTFFVFLRKWIEDGKAIFEERKGVRLRDYEQVVAHGTPTEKSLMMAQMMQDPTPVAGGVDRSKIKYHADDDAAVKTMNIVINVDTSATAKKDDGDPCALVVWGLTAGKELHALEAFDKHMTIAELCEEMFRLYGKYEAMGVPPLWITVQKEVIEKILLQFLNPLMKERGKQLPLWPATVHKQNKRARIGRLIPWIESGAAKLRPTMTDFENQLVYGAKAEHDDIADAASDVMDVLQWPEGVAEKNEEKKEEFCGCRSEMEAWRALSQQVAKAEKEQEERAQRAEQIEDYEFADAM